MQADKLRQFKEQMTANSLKQLLSYYLKTPSTTFSVRTASNGTIRVKIKDPSICLQTAREIASRYESINYCDSTGEILSGFNRFIFVDYDLEIKLNKL